MAHPKLPDIDYLKQLLIYDENTGKLFWRYDRSNIIKAGSEAGSLKPKGYIEIKIDGKIYKAHRIIFWIMTSIDPTGKLIDHINGNRSDNRIENLRLSTNGENRANAKVNSNNVLGLKNIFIYDAAKRKTKYYIVCVTKHGKSKTKYFRIDDPEALEKAIAYRDSLAESMHCEFARTL